jgi:hypothetical protein
MNVQLTLTFLQSHLPVADSLKRLHLNYPTPLSAHAIITVKNGGKLLSKYDAKSQFLRNDPDALGQFRSDGTISQLETWNTRSSIAVSENANPDSIPNWT